MGSYEVDELSGVDDFGVFPEGGEMALVASDEVVGSRSFGAFEEDIVARIYGDLERT